jgi:hypothetical protein
MHFEYLRSCILRARLSLIIGRWSTIRDGADETTTTWFLRVLKRTVFDIEGCVHSDMTLRDRVVICDVLKQALVFAQLQEMQRALQLVNNANGYMTHIFGV